MCKVGVLMDELWMNYVSEMKDPSLRPGVHSAVGEAIRNIWIKKYV